MSYEITLCPREPDQDWTQALAAADAEDTGVQDDPDALTAGVETFRRIEQRLRDELSGELETWVAEETGGDVYGELTAVDSGIQVELFDRSAAVTITDAEAGDDESREATERQAARAVEVVAAETGYEPYDHQAQRSFDGTFVTAPATDPDPAAGGPAGAPDPAGRSAAEAARRDPASLRRRGWVYVVLGLAIVLFAGNRLTSGDSGALTVILLVIGVLDLLGGAFLLAVSRRVPDDS
ncbi:hypothetical protein [Serinicoccus kebangsaanensis]|uniref:hypothetical protein n=1 Tax=Serinicoccus kebangsaanensis TaxID=2602069 RepID=UPI00124BE493|nr:hypothetical protein [Serinicoccus kebangsaanensis]